MTNELLPRDLDRFGSVFKRLREENCFGSPVIAIHPGQIHESPYSRVLSATLERSKAPALHVFLKLPQALRDRQEWHSDLERIAAEYSNTCTAFRVMPADRGLCVPRPLAYFPEEGCLVTEAGKGVPLRDYLRSFVLRPFRGRPPDRDLQVFRRIGEWVQAFQSGLPCEGKTSLHQLRAYVGERLERLVGKGVFSQRLCEDVLRFFDESAALLTPADFALAAGHSDFCPDNILVDDVAITVLDLGNMGPKVRLHDLGHLYVHMEIVGSKPWMSRREIACLQLAMLRGYDARLTSECRLFTLMRILNTITTLVQRTSSAKPESLKNTLVIRSQIRSIRRMLQGQQQ